MAVTRATFYQRFSEFDLTDGVTLDAAQDARVDATLAASEAFHDRNLFSSSAQADEAVMYYTAHLLARSAFSVNARLQKSRGDDNLVTGEDIYHEVWVRTIRAAAAGNRVP